MKRFLVTGATGFIGSAVARRLTAEGHGVIAPGHDDLDFLSATSDRLSRLVAEAGATHCIHCAWYTNHADYLVHEVNRSWLASSRRLANACRDLRFVALGTCLEYDVSGVDGPCVEGETPLAPETLYARCKRDLHNSLEAQGGDFAWARVFFVYGPGDRAGRLVPRLLEHFSLGQEFGPTYGALRRDYIHVDDLAAQIVRIAQADVRSAINTGTGAAPSLSEIFAAGAAAFGRPELARANRDTGGQPLRIQADLTRFRRTVGDPQARDIATGLRDLIR